MSGGQQTYTRFSVAQRLEHATMLTSFIVLALTGLPQKFSGEAWARGLINLLGGIDSTRQIHHVAAAVLLVVSALHIVAVGYRLYVKRARPAMLPSVKDVRDGIGSLLYNLGFRKNHTQSGRFTWEEKVEYWSLVWGILIMALTGFAMWNPIATASLLPGEVIPAAKAAHGAEAILAVLAVIVWHMYSVHLKRFNTAMFTGQINEHQMLEEHPLELADIKAGLAQLPQDPAAFRKRQRRYVPAASVIAVVMLFGIYRFMTFEKTAIDTVPPRILTSEAVFLPLTPTPLPTPRPTPTPAPTQPSVEASWAAIGAVLERNCTSCHNGTVANLDFTTYASAMKGGKDGAVIKPGDPANSLIIQKVGGGNHPGKLSGPELDALTKWIAAGALEQPGASASAAAKPVWTGDIAVLLSNKCGGCHTDTPQPGNGLLLDTYANALKGGKTGPAIVPNDPDKSVLVTVQAVGGHSGQLTPDELNRVIEWINAGAPEK